MVWITEHTLQVRYPGNSVNDPWIRNYGVGNRPFLANYKNKIHQGNLDLIATLNNASRYRGNPKNVSECIWWL